MNAPPSSSNFQELVMELRSDLFHKDIKIAGYRLYSAIDTAVTLYEKKLTYCGTINENIRKVSLQKLTPLKNEKMSRLRFSGRKTVQTC